MSLNEVSEINFATTGANPTAQISIDNTGDILLTPATGATVLFNNLSLSGASSSDPTATITADASGDIILTPASGAKCNLGGVVLYTNDSTQYIQSNGFSNLCIGNSDENAISLQSTNYITLNGLQVSGGKAGTTIQTATSTDSITVSAANVSITASAAATTANPNIELTGNIIGFNGQVEMMNNSPLVLATCYSGISTATGAIMYYNESIVVFIEGSWYPLSMGSAITF